MVDRINQVIKNAQIVSQAVMLNFTQARLFQNILGRR